MKGLWAIRKDGACWCWQDNEWPCKDFWEFSHLLGEKPARAARGTHLISPPFFFFFFSPPLGFYSVAAVVAHGSGWVFSRRMAAEGKVSEQSLFRYGVSLIALQINTHAAHSISCVGLCVCVFSMCVYMCIYSFVFLRVCACARACACACACVRVQARASA